MALMNGLRKNAFGWCLIALLISFDITYYVLLKNNLYFACFLSTSHFYPFVINFIILIWVGFYLKQWWLLAVIVIAMIILIIPFVLLLGFASEQDYLELESPQKSQKLIIEHWTATLGETNYIFNFYQENRLTGGVLVKQLENQSLKFMVTYDSNVTVDDILSLNRPHWISEKRVLFASMDGEKEVILK